METDETIDGRETDTHGLRTRKKERQRKTRSQDASSGATGCSRQICTVIRRLVSGLH